MRTEEEVESWYEEEKKKSLEKFLAALEKKEGGEKAEHGYKKDLNALFGKYKKLKLGIIRAQSDKATAAAAAAAKKAKAKSSLEKLLNKPMAKLMAVLRLMLRLIKR